MNRSNSMIARLLAAVAVLGAPGCDDFQPDPESRPNGRAFAVQSVWNRAPGDAEMGEPPGPGRLPTQLAISSRAGASLAATDATALILYDAGGPWGGLGELYAIGTANLVSHFATWVAKPAVEYACGELATYTAAFYTGSTYDEPLPGCLLDDVLSATTPVTWSGFNIWQLVDRAGWNEYLDKYGWTWVGLDFATVGAVDYKAESLARYASNPSGILDILITDPTRVEVLASARRADGTAFPWASRSGNLTYVGEVPFTYMSEEDRYLIYADLLFDSLAPATPERHRALVRIEDITPKSDPAQLRAIADYLWSQRVPFGYAVVAEYRDPFGFYNGGTPEVVTLRQKPLLRAALEYMRLRGGVAVMHGFTHQWDGDINPYTGVSADDTEFYRTVEEPDFRVSYLGPLPGDSVSWATGRITEARRRYALALMAAPKIFELPHYAGSAATYQAVNNQFTTRWDRTLYFGGVLNRLEPDYSLVFGQLFPYAVRDVYGTKVIPETLGSIEPEPFHIFPARSPADLINAAAKVKVVRDGVAGFYFHPFFALADLRATVTGIRGLGYTFVSPNSL